MRENSAKVCSKTEELVDRFCLVRWYLFQIGIKKFLNPTDVKYNELKNTENGFSFRVTITGTFRTNKEIPS
jgi:hypothetical protein